MTNLRPHMTKSERQEYDAARKITDASPDAYRTKGLIERRVRARLRRAAQKTSGQTPRFSPAVAGKCGAGGFRAMIGEN